MGRERVVRGKRQQEQQAIYNQMLCEEIEVAVKSTNNDGKGDKRTVQRIKDNYDFIMECQELLTKKMSPEKIFSRIMMGKLQGVLLVDAERTLKVEDYIRYIAQQLTEHTTALMRWTNGGPWGLPMMEASDGTLVLDQEKIYKLWLQTVMQWWENDSFPTINEGRGAGKNGKKILSLNYNKRDIALLFMMVFDFTVSESDAFLEEFSLIKDRDIVRPLYALDYKESLFRWIMLWNEKHDRQISYEEACELYLEYGEWLLKEMKPRIEEVCKVFPDVFSNIEIPNDALDLFDREKAENLKRLMALIVHVERKRDERKVHQKGFSLELSEMKHYNENTRVNRGTKYAWSELSRLTDYREDAFQLAFERFKNTSLEFISEAHWSQFSKIVSLFLRSVTSNPNQGLVAKTQKQKEDNSDVNMRNEKLEKYTNKEVLRDSMLDAFENLKQTNASFAFDANEICEILRRHTEAKGVLVNLVRPIRRQDAIAYEKEKLDGSSMISNMLNRYHIWCTGDVLKQNSDDQNTEKIKEVKSPHEEFKRDKILKVALAAGIESREELKDALQLSGNREFQYLDPKEALVYLLTLYCEEINAVIDQADAIVRNLVQTKMSLPSRVKNGVDLVYQISRLPIEYQIALPGEIRISLKQSELSPDERKRLTNLLDEWWYEAKDKLNNRLRWSLVELIRKADFMKILYEVKQCDDKELDKIRQKLFYDPYTKDFVRISANKKGVLEQMDWIRVIGKLYDVMKRIFTDDGIKFVFSSAYSENDLLSVDRVLDIEEDDTNTLAEQYCSLIEEELAEQLQVSEKEELIVLSDQDIRTCLKDFLEVFCNCSFMKQEEPAVEARYAFEQWFCILGTLQYFDIDVKEEQRALDQALRTWKQGILMLQEEKRNAWERRRPKGRPSKYNFDDLGDW